MSVEIDMSGPNKRSAVIRTLEKTVINESGCLIFCGARTKNGYGVIGIDERTALTHRIMYEAVSGLIPDGFELDHLCRNRACCNPAHLEPVTRKENLRRSPLHYAARTHCSNGHHFNAENTYIYTRSDGGQNRQCRACKRERERERRRKLRKAARADARR